MKTSRLLFALLVLGLGSSAYAAGDAEAGKTKSAMCAACHGANGVSPTDFWPNLAGQKAGYLAKQLKDFKAGNRADPSMAPMAANLTDQDIEDLAAYYAGLE